MQQIKCELCCNPLNHINNSYYYKCNFCSKYDVAYQYINNKLEYWHLTTTYNNERYSLFSNKDTLYIDGVKSCFVIKDPNFNILYEVNYFMIIKDGIDFFERFIRLSTFM
jgi:hypothetical protein